MKEGASIHPIRVHRLAHVKVKIFEVGRNMLGIIILSPGLKCFHFGLVGALLLELLYHFLKVHCSTGEAISQLVITGRDKDMHKDGKDASLPFSCARYSFFVVNALDPEASSPRKFKRKPSTTSMTCLRESSNPSSASSAEALAPISMERFEIISPYISRNACDVYFRINGD